MQTVYIHINNEEAVMAEVDELPQSSDQFILALNPRKRDGKDLHYLMEGVSKVMIPWWRITFVEVIQTEQEEEVFTFIRE
ncbi:MAG: hypothetical protein L0154_09520 [Chloroflexi bacterium]|nr:hypothetical protein [Chloroflexota bacterium]